MRTLLTFLTFLLMAGSAIGQTQGVSVRATNGFSYGTLTGQKIVATNFTGNGSGLTNVPSVWTNVSGVYQTRTNSYDQYYNFLMFRNRLAANTNSLWAFDAVLDPGSEYMEMTSELQLDTFLRQFSWYADVSSMYFKMNQGGNVLLGLEPTTSDGTTAYNFDTTIAHTSGNLLEIKNLTVPVLSVAFDGAITGNGSGLTNIPASAISNVATNNGNNQFSASQTINGNFTNTGFSSTTTNYSTKLRVGGAAESSDAINVTGTINASSTINAATDIQAANRVRIGGSSGMYFESGLFNSLYIGNSVSTVTNIVLYGRAGGASNFPTNAAINHITGNPPTIRFWNATNGPADVIVSGSLTTTNGVFGASGSIMLTTNVSVAMAANTYTNVGNYDYTTVFGNVTASADALTNGTAGRYFVAIHAAFAGAGAASLYEGAVFTNTVECTIIEWQRDVTTTFGSASASGIITLPANCRIEYKIKNPDAETATFAKLGLTAMGAN